MKSSEPECLAGWGLVLDDRVPFQVQDQTKAMVMDNIVYLLNQFLAQACFDHVLFSWVMDQPETVQQIYNRLQGNFTFYHFTLLPSSTQLRRQLQQDIDRGLRTADCIPQSLSRLTHYDQIESEKIKSMDNLRKQLPGKFSVV